MKRGGYTIMLNTIWLTIIFLMGGCSLSIESTSTGDYGSRDRFEKVIAEIIMDSENAVQQILKNQHPKNVDSDLKSYAEKHFSKAEELVTQHTLAFKKSIPFVSHIDYLEKRKTLLEYTTKVKVSLEIIDSDFASATAFPNGTIIVTTPLISAFPITEESYDSALLGVLIHEIIHVRDGHAIAQWATAKGRNELIADKFLGTLAKMTAIIPILSIKYEHEYETSFKGAKYLPELSEYAADYGAVALLEQNNFAKDEYIVFLEDVNSTTTKSGKRLEKPFAWLQGRIECLEFFLDTQPHNKYLTIIKIGSAEDGDQVYFTIDPNLSFQLSKDIDDMEKIRNALFPAGKGDRLTDKQIQDVLLRNIEILNFKECSLKKIFQQQKEVGGVLQIPGFDIYMFEQFNNCMIEQLIQ